MDHVTHASRWAAAHTTAHERRIGLPLVVTQTDGVGGRVASMDPDPIKAWACGYPYTHIECMQLLPRRIHADQEWQ